MDTVVGLVTIGRLVGCQFDGEQWVSVGACSISIFSARSCFLFLGMSTLSVMLN